MNSCLKSASIDFSESDLRVLAFLARHGDRMLELLAGAETFNFNHDMIRSFFARVGPEVDRQLRQS